MILVTSKRKLTQMLLELDSPLSFSEKLKDKLPTSSHGQLNS